MPPPPPKKKKISAVKPPLASVQSAGPGLMFSRTSFFLPNRGTDGGKVPAPVVVSSALPSPFERRFEPMRRFIRDRETGEPYAEWIGESAVCLSTGQELFRSRRSRLNEEDEFAAAFEGGEASGGMQVRLDYSVPKQRHPNDYSVSTEDMLASGFITLDAFREPNGAAVRLRDYEAFLKEKEEAAAAAAVR